MNARPIFRVMVSSTFEDLEDPRAEIIRLMGRHELHPVVMEHSPARPTLDTRASSLQMVDSVDAYIGIIGYRYGGRVPPEDLSLTELEWRRARERGIPRCFLLMSDDYAVPRRLLEAVSARDRESLAEFRARVEADRVCAYFSNGTELTLQATHALDELRRILDAQAGSPEAPERRRPAPAQPWQDDPRLELLCDRQSASMGFEQELERRVDPLRPGCLLLFGEADQAPGDFFERIADILRNPRYVKRFQQPAIVHITFDRHLYEEKEDIGVHILRKALEDLDGDDAGGELYDLFNLHSARRRPDQARTVGFKALNAALKRLKVQLCLIRGIVHVESHAAAGWWIEGFQELRQQLTLQPGGPQIVLAVAIQYPRGWWLLRPSRDVTRFFRRHFPAAFAESQRRSQLGEGLDAAGLTVRRLASVTRVDVHLWLEEPLVRGHIERARISRQQFFQPFERSSEQPMWDVLEHLRGVLRGDPVRNRK